MLLSAWWLGFSPRGSATDDAAAFSADHGNRAVGRCSRIASDALIPFVAAVSRNQDKDTCRRGESRTHRRHHGRHPPGSKSWHPPGMFLFHRKLWHRIASTRRLRQQAVFQGVTARRQDRWRWLKSSDRPRTRCIPEFKCSFPTPWQAPPRRAHANTLKFTFSRIGRTRTTEDVLSALQAH
jgi:hypothetical protein